jgi:hypothetical protein
MRLHIYVFFAMIFLFNLLNPVIAFAYSYGNPNEEHVAIVYTQMVAKLTENPPNYNEALIIYQTVQEDIDMHMGPEPSKVILSGFETKDANKIISDMEKILVLNVARRFESVDRNFEDYNTSKKLLAKAHATYKTLSPKVIEHNANIDQKITEEFNKALESIGNPGLFGVGKKEPNQEIFKNAKQNILTHLQDIFGLDSLDVGHFSESTTEDLETSNKVNWTDISSFKNWFPLIILVTVILGTIVFVKRKRR